MQPPDHLFVIGAMKAGTTTAFHQVASHPEIVPCRIKEPNFFASEANWAKGWSWYDALWPDHDGLRLEASGAYSRFPYDPGVPERIKQALEDQGRTARFLYTIRDPIERIRSHLSHAVAAGGGYDERAHGHGGIDGYLLTISSYARQLDEYRRVFGQDALHVIVLENLRDAPAATLADVWRFLGVDDAWSPPDPGARHNPTIGLWRRGRMWRSLRWSRLERAGMALPAPVRRRLRPLLGRRVTERLELSDEQKAMYRYLLAPDAARLASEYGVDTSKWKTLHASP